MKLRKFSIMLILTLCLSLAPAAAFASSTEVTLDAIASVQQGGSVKISGTSTLTEVIIKVTRPGNSTVFYDIAKVNNGKFTSTFTLGSNESAGTYKVVAGQADQVAAQEFTVTTGGTGVAPVPGTITPGSPGGGGPAGPPPPKPKPVTPVNSNAVPVEVDTSKNITKTTSPRIRFIFGCRLGCLHRC